MFIIPSLDFEFNKGWSHQSIDHSHPISSKRTWYSRSRACFAHPRLTKYGLRNSRSQKNRRRCLNNHLNKTIIPQEIPPNVQPAFHCQPAIPLVGPMAAFTIVAIQAIINSWTFSLTFSKPAEKTRGNGDHWFIGGNWWNMRFLNHGWWDRDLLGGQFSKTTPKKSEIYWDAWMIPLGIRWKPSSSWNHPGYETRLQHRPATMRLWIFRWYASRVARPRCNSQNRWWSGHPLWPSACPTSTKKMKTNHQQQINYSNKSSNNLPYHH